MSSAVPYQRRVIDEDLDELVADLPAIALEGPKGVGKTRTALQRARTVYWLDDAAEFAVVQAEPSRLLGGKTPVLIDEWQRLPEIWDLVRRAVDEGAAPGSFLLTGSATPNPPPMHSGAGRIVTMRMRPLSIVERVGDGSVSVANLLSGDLTQIRGETTVTLTRYVEEILASGLPGVRGLRERARRHQLESYVARTIDRDIPEAATSGIRNPSALRRWMAAYAAASSTTVSFEKVRDAASGGDEHKPSRETAQSYREALTRIWMLDDVAAWIPSHNRLSQLGHAPKHQLADPAIAAQLLGVQASTLLAGEGPGPASVRNGTLLGALFESLVTQSVQVYAARNEARVGHLRTARGRQEVDLIVERADGCVVAIEVKLARAPADADGKHLHWLAEKLGERLLDRVIVSTGPVAYRRADGIAVVPLALLGP